MEESFIEAETLVHDNPGARSANHPVHLDRSLEVEFFFSIAKNNYFPRGQIKNDRGEGGTNQDDDGVIHFYPSDLNELVYDRYSFCNNYGGGDRIIYYTSGQEDKDELGGIMNRVGEYLKFICELYDSNPVVPGKFYYYSLFILFTKSFTKNPER